MKTNLIKGIAALGVAGVLTAVGAQNRAETFESYGLEGPVLQMAQSCDRSMRHNDLEFNKGSSNHAGCACMARTVANDIKNPDYEFLNKSFGDMLEAKGNNDDDAAAGVLMTAMLSGGDGNAEDLMTMMGAMSTCSDRGSEKEIRQAYVAENPQVVAAASSENATPKRTTLRASQSNSTQGQRTTKTASASKPTGKCAALTEKQVAQREEIASESGLRFDRSNCKMYSL